MEALRVVRVDLDHGIDGEAGAAAGELLPDAGVDRGWWRGVVVADVGERGGGCGVGECTGGGTIGASAQPGESLANVVDGDEGEDAGLSRGATASVFVSGGVEPVTDGAIGCGRALVEGDNGDVP
jgi:hypothetical protein